MTVKELIQELGSLNPEMEVRLAFQPNRPMEFALEKVVTVHGHAYLCEGGFEGFMDDETVIELDW
jgi:hypothetical protein